MTLPELMRGLRGGRSVSEVASLIGLDRRTIWSWETQGPSGRKPEPQHLQRALDAYRADESQRLQAWTLLAGASASPPSAA